MINYTKQASLSNYGEEEDEIYFIQTRQAQKYMFTNCMYTKNIIIMCINILQNNTSTVKYYTIIQRNVTNVTD